MVGRQRQCALNPARGVARTCTGRTTTLVPDGRAWVEINSARLIMRMHPHARLCRSSMVRRSRGYGRGCCCYLDRETWDDPRAGCVDHLLGQYQAGHSCFVVDGRHPDQPSRDALTHHADRPDRPSPISPRGLQRAPRGCPRRAVRQLKCGVGRNHSAPAMSAPRDLYGRTTAQGPSPRRRTGAISFCVVT
jgi:hypothetical protein